MLNMHRSLLLFLVGLVGCQANTFLLPQNRINPSLHNNLKPAGKARSTAVIPRGGGNSTSFAKNHPFAFQLMIATAKTTAADIIVQTAAEGKSLSNIDWKRTFVFIAFGSAYLGGFQYWLMVNKYRDWFPTMDRFAKSSLEEKLKDKDGILDAFKMVLFDVIVHLPLLYFPTYYTVKEFISGETWNPADWVKDGVTKYSKNMKEDLLAMIKLWGPSDCIQFALPIHTRLPFRHLVSFFWTAYVSFTRGSIEKDDIIQPLETATSE